MTLAEVSRRGQEAIQKMMAAMRDGWTGEVRFYFRDGEPQKVKRIESETLDGDGLDTRTDGEYT